MSSNKNANSTIADLRARLNASEAELEQARSTIAELRAQLHQQQQPSHQPPSQMYGPGAAAAASTENEEDDGPSWHQLADAALRATAAREAARASAIPSLTEEQRKKIANNDAAFRASPEYRKQQLAQARAVRSAFAMYQDPTLEYPRDFGGRRTRRRYKTRSSRKRHTRR